MVKKMKDIVLGMPIGTAAARLRKALLFDMSKKLDLDRCYHCKKQIESIDEFSIEHKQAWLRADDPVATFFDLANIGFSHLSCNARMAMRHKTSPEHKAKLARAAEARNWPKKRLNRQRKRDAERASRKSHQALF